MAYKTLQFSKLVKSKRQKKEVPFSWHEAMKRGVEFELDSGEKLLVRFMENEDVPEVLEIERVTFPSPWSKASFFYRLHERDYNISLVALIDGKVAGYAVSYVMFDDFHVCNIAVRKDKRRQHLGQVLLWISLHIGVEKDCTIANLEVRKSNKPAISLYEKFGFEIYGVRKNYYEREHEDALLMRKKLSWELPYGMV